MNLELEAEFVEIEASGTKVECLVRYYESSGWTSFLDLYGDDGELFCLRGDYCDKARAAQMIVLYEQAFARGIIEGKHQKITEIRACLGI